MKFSLLLVLSVGNTVFQTVLAIFGVPGGVITAAIAALATLALIDLAMVSPRGLNYRRIRLMLALPILGIMSLAWAIEPDLGTSKLVVFAGRAILPAAGLAIWVTTFGGWDRAKRTLPRVIRFMLWGTLMLTVLIGDTARFTDRAEVAGTNPIWLGRSVVMLVVLLVALQPRPTNRGVRAADLVCVAVTLVLLGARGPIAAYLVFLVWMLHTSTSVGSTGATTRRMASSIVLALGATLVGFGLVPLGRFEGVFGADRDDNSEARLRNLELAWDQFTDRPFLGSGVGGFQGIREGAYPHNLVAEIGVELGLLGVALLFILLDYVLRRSDAESTVKVGVVVGLCVAMFSGNLGGNEGMWLFIGLGIGQSVVRSRMDGHLVKDPLRQAPGAITAT